MLRDFITYIKSISSTLLIKVATVATYLGILSVFVFCLSVTISIGLK